MTTLANRRSAILLFSLPDCLHSHRTRLVIKEKEITAEMYEIDKDNISQEIKEISPYDEFPTLVDRDLVLQNSRVIIEYLDERFPHPPLLPVDPVSRAKFRLALNKIEHQWYPEFSQAYQKGSLDPMFIEKIKAYFLEILPLISNKYFMSDDFGLVDCSLAPLLWRIKDLDIELSENKKAFLNYSERIFDRESFQESLTETEKEI
ncbi:MAG: stringent starvation protein A [Gammaproteobacteria bacterium]|nr:stringent starvation protein A [Gammaproteobacteria bacterium]|tara:strand:+ start:117390 stop:118004 length:615 start_codon:yes stop_codon:yes gene_type:complete